MSLGSGFGILEIAAWPGKWGSRVATGLDSSPFSVLLKSPLSRAAPPHLDLTNDARPSPGPESAHRTKLLDMPKPRMGIVWGGCKATCTSATTSESVAEALDGNSDPGRPPARAAASAFCSLLGEPLKHGLGEGRYPMPAARTSRRCSQSHPYLQIYSHCAYLATIRGMPSRVLLATDEPPSRMCLRTMLAVRSWLCA